MKFYRYIAVNYADHDHNGELVSSRFPNPKIHLEEYELFEETPKGYRLCYRDPNGLHSPSKWVSKTARKRFAYPTKEEALNSFIKKKERQIKILTYQLENSKVALYLAKEIKL